MRYEIVVGLDANEDTDLTIATGEGNDTIVLVGGNIAINDAEDGFNGSVTITDFNANADSLVIFEFDGFTAQNLVDGAIADAKSLYEAVSAVADIVEAGGTNITAYAKFVFEGNTYIYGDIEGDDGLGTDDLLIGLTGIVNLNNDNVAGVFGE